MAIRGQWQKPFWIIVFIFLAGAIIQELRSKTSPVKGARHQMQTYYIGRFSISVPSLMEQKARSSTFKYAEIAEIPWRKNESSEQARTSEWERFLAEVKKISPPEGKRSAIIQNYDFPGLGKWTKGISFYNDQFSFKGAEWALLMDTGALGVWLKTDGIDVKKELEDPRTVPNYRGIVEAYQPLDLKNLNLPQPGDRFYLQHGVINLPYSEQEESIARFEGHPLDLSLLIEMYMDFTKERETTSLINGTRAMLAAALLTPGNSISKIRLRKREVAGMPGEESVLKATEGDDKDVVFTWQYNGKDDSGEYPTTRIEMQSHDHSHLKEKLEIWDTILDSMKPMFVRKN